MTIKYSENSRGILKDGHQMFAQDVVKDLNRKVYLESNKLELESQVKWLLSKVGVDESGVYLVSGNAKLDFKESMEFLKVHLVNKNNSTTN